MIFLTGDTHGDIDIGKLSSKRFIQGKTLTKDDYVIILGDFGFIWENEPDVTEKYWLKWFSEKPWTTLFIDGNHENHDRLNNLPVEEWHGGKVHKINDSVIHLMRGQIFELNGKSFFTFGGAKSVDVESRREGISWWRGEIPNYQETNEGVDNLVAHGSQVDYVLTHTCVSEVCRMVVNGFGGGYIDPDPTTKILDQFHSMMAFKKWYFGHWHVDKDFGRYECLYDKIIKLGD